MRSILFQIAPDSCRKCRSHTCSILCDIRAQILSNVIRGTLGVRTPKIVDLCLLTHSCEGIIHALRSFPVVSLAMCCMPAMPVSPNANLMCSKIRMSSTGICRTSGSCSDMLSSRSPRRCVSPKTPSSSLSSSSHSDSSATLYSLRLPSTFRLLLTTCGRSSGSGTWLRITVS